MTKNSRDCIKMTKKSRYYIKITKNSRYTQRYILHTNFTEGVDLKFGIFMNKVSKYVYKKLKLDLLDLPDEMYHDMYSDKWSARDVSNLVVDNFLNPLKFLN